MELKTQNKTIIKHFCYLMNDACIIWVSQLVFAETIDIPRLTSFTCVSDSTILQCNAH